jgi:hypothetical protein
MTMSRELRISAAVLSAFILSGMLWAHGDKPHYAGTVTAVDAGHIELKAKDGKTISLKLDKDTKVLKDDTVGTLEDVTVGDRVVVHLGGTATDLVVREIRLGTGDVEQKGGEHHHHN